jgi:hypothetical protein
MYVMYYMSMLRYWQLIRILVRTNHPCLRVRHHTHLGKGSLFHKSYGPSGTQEGNTTSGISTHGLRPPPPLEWQTKVAPPHVL